MAKKKRNVDADQMDLIDVAPANAKKIVEAARVYVKLQSTRATALAKEAVNVNARPGSIWEICWICRKV